MSWTLAPFFCDIICARSLSLQRHKGVHISLLSQIGLPIECPHLLFIEFLLENVFLLKCLISSRKLHDKTRKNILIFRFYILVMSVILKFCWKHMKERLCLSKMKFLVFTARTRNFIKSKLLWPNKIKKAISKSHIATGRPIEN